MMKARWLMLGTAAAALLWRRSLRRGMKRGAFADRVLVTGGARGLGLELARLLAARGARVAICSRNLTQLERARDELARRFDCEVHAEACDVSDPDAVARLVRALETKWGGVDLVVNCAGVIQVGPARLMNLHDVDEAMESNFWGVVNTMQAASPGMIARGWGRFLNVASLGGEVPLPHLVPYSSSKFAALAYSAGMGVELRRLGIGVTTAVPGLMRTGSSVNAWFKGDARQEASWFAAAARLPVLSMSSESAAREMLEGLERGESLVFVGWSASFARVAFALAPNLVLRALSGVERLLPDIPRGVDRRADAEPGGRYIRRPGKAALRNNQLAG